MKEDEVPTSGTLGMLRLIPESSGPEVERCWSALGCESLHHYKVASQEQVRRLGKKLFFGIIDILRNYKKMFINFKKTWSSFEKTLNSCDAFKKFS